ncbi:MAG: hypothetical protein NUW00_00560, partial [Candidatus Kaiserbacteria bacterium]|nr:hypothetical protein [Candidatus Kaiserbacteria bacterium]
MKKFEGLNPSNPIEQEPVKDWTEYFPDGYSKEMKDFFLLHGNENDQDVNEAINTSVRHLMQMRTEVIKMGFKDFDSYKRIKDKYYKEKWTWDEMQESFLFRFKDDADKNSHDGLGFIVDYFVTTEFDSLVKQHLEGVFEQMARKSYGGRLLEYSTSHRKFAYFLSENEQECFFGYSADEQLYKIIDEIIREKIDVCVVAPRSALDSARIIQGAFKYISSVDPDISSPFFTFPGQKSSYNIENIAKCITDDNLREVILNGRDIEYVIENIIMVSNQHDDAEKKEIARRLRFDVTTISPVLKAIERKIKTGDEEIHVGVYDESINTGRTRDSLVIIVEICFKFLQEKYPGIRFSIPFKIPPIDTGGGQGGWSSGGYGTQRYENKPLERISFKDEPLKHEAAVLMNTTAGLIGRHFGDTWNLVYHLE